MRKSLLVLLTAFLMTGVAQAQAILGYLPEYQYYGNSNICYSKYTDIAYSFMNPTTTGDISYTSDALYGFNVNIFDAVKTKCSQNGVKLWIAIGGADTQDQRSARLNSVAGNNTYRATFITAIVNFAILHNLEGIDIDWEFPKTSTEIANHKQFVVDLRTKINASTKPGLKIGVTVGGEYLTNPNHLQYVDQTVFSSADYINLMTYDFPVGHPSAGVHHSSVVNAIGSMNAWNTQKGVPYNKIRLGLPFYGKGSTNRNANSGGIPFSQLFQSNSNAVNTNNVTLNGTTYYYNGKTELEDKITQSFAKGINGVMVWDIAQDNSACALSNIVYDKVNSTCAAPQPNLGLDVSVCKAGDTKVFDAGTPPGPGNTVQWYKDEVLIANASGQTYTANTAGTYKVVYSASTCSKQDAAVLSVGSSITTQGTTVCAGSNATVSIVTPSTGTNFSWWDAAVGGTQLATGTRSYTASAITASKNVYAQEESATGISKSIGPSLIIDNSTAYAQYTKVGQFAHYIDVKQNLNIQSVKVYINKAAAATLTLKVVVYNADGKTVVKSGTAQTIPTLTATYYEAVVVNANVELVPGQYFICVEADKPSYSLTKNDGVVQTAPQADMDIKDGSTVVMTMQGRSIQRFSATGFINLENPDGGLNDNYGMLFDIKVTTGAAASNCGRALAAITVNSAANTGLAVVAKTASVCVGAAGTVTLKASESGISYQAYVSTATAPTLVAVGQAFIGNGQDIDITIAADELTTASETSNEAIITIKGTKNGCGTVTLAATPSIVLNAKPATPGVITFTSPVCQGVTGQAVSVAAVPTATSYTWSYSGNGATFAATTATTNVGFSGTATSGNITVTATNSCGTSAASAAKAVVVNAKPATPGAITGPVSVTGTGTQTASFSVTAVSGVTYNWTYSPAANVTISNGATASPSIAFGVGSASGTLSVTAANACGTNTTAATKAIVVSIISDVKDDLLANGFALLPNPSASDFNVKIANVSDVEVVIYNSLGQIVTSITDNTDHLSFGAGLQAGVYFAKISVNGKSHTYKLIKE